MFTQDTIIYGSELIGDEDFFKGMAVIDTISIESLPQHRFTCYLCVNGKKRAWIADKLIPRQAKLEYDRIALRQRFAPSKMRQNEADRAMLHQFYGMLVTTGITKANNVPSRSKFNHNGDMVYILDGHAFEEHVLPVISQEKKFDVWLDRMVDLGFVLWTCANDQFILQHPAFQMSVQRISLIGKNTVMYAQSTSKSKRKKGSRPKRKIRSPSAREKKGSPAKGKKGLPSKRNFNDISSRDRYSDISYEEDDEPTEPEHKRGKLK